MIDFIDYENASTHDLTMKLRKEMELQVGMDCPSDTK